MNHIGKVVLLNFLETQMKKEQVGFQKGWSKTDQISVLNIIVEKFLEWNSSHCINFLDYEKTFQCWQGNPGERLWESISTVKRESLWKWLRHYGVPKNMPGLIQRMYKGMIMHNADELSDPFQINTDQHRSMAGLLILTLSVHDTNWVHHERVNSGKIKWDTTESYN